MEIWKDIPNYEGLYEASNRGNIRSKEGKVTYTERHGKRVWKSRVLKEKNPSGRDKRVTLWKDGDHKDYLVHRLVAKTFIPNPENKPCINHIDGNPRNNNAENLEWCTYEENERHSRDNGLDGHSQVIFLINKETGMKSKFYSMASASRFLGRSNGYISGVLSTGKQETDRHLIVKE